MFSSDKEIDLSIVIPYYNQPEQLAKVLSNLHEQEGISLEVFVVDDASKHTCDNLIEEFKDKGLNLTLLKQKERQFTLKARFCGMKQAKGKYLAFMDSDDALCASDVYAKVFQEAVEKEADILHFVTHYTTKHGLTAVWENAYPFYVGSLEGKDIFKKWVESECKAHSVWNKLYSKRLYTKILELEHNIFIKRIEDFYLNSYFLFFAKKYVSSLVPVYYYAPPKGGHLEKYAARSLDAMRMYYAFPQIFEKFGIDEDVLNGFKVYLRMLTTYNVGHMCKEMKIASDINSLGDVLCSQEVEKILQYGSKKDFTMAFFIANASNAQKIIDIHLQ